MPSNLCSSKGAVRYSLMSDQRMLTLFKIMCIIKCVPKLLAWLRNAHIALANPARPAVIDELKRENESAHSISLKRPRAN